MGGHLSGAGEPARIVRSRLSAAAAMVCLAGCGSGGPASSSGETSSAPVAAAPAPSSPAGPDAAAIPEAEVKALVEAWLGAQNRGDLAAYLALYAERFEGVRRSGDRVARMDRRGWTADRTRMFAKKMVVEADGLQIGATPGLAQVTFTQTWASGAYKDVGPKLLVLVRERRALRIAREEMLVSAIQGVRRLPPHSPDEVAFVIQDGGSRVVLDPAARSSWGEGAPELLADAVPFPTRVRVSPRKLPEGLATWAGKKMRLYGPSGPVCEATLGDLSLIGRVIPHFGEVARWHGTGEHAGEGALSKGAIARAAWSLAEGARPHGVVLAADLVDARGDCKAALWAHPASASESRVARAEEAGEALSRRVLAELRKLPEYKEIQPTSEGPAPWDERGKTEVALMRHPSGRQLAFISANAVEGCGGFQGNLSAVFEVSGDRLQLAGKPAGSPPEMPAGVIEAGGRLEILFPERLLRGETGYDQIDALGIPFLDCGC